MYFYEGVLQRRPIFLTSRRSPVGSRRAGTPAVTSNTRSCGPLVQLVATFNTLLKPISDFILKPSNAAFTQLYCRRKIPNFLQIVDCAAAKTCDFLNVIET